ncbi:MAG: barstar family protein [Firmicutes bacterium]|nr:barstar family protein [Bacillota bacterium]
MGREVRKFELDFSKCSTWGEVYREIKKKLDLPDWCGENLDALWDALTGMMYTPAEITVSKNVANKGLVSVVEQIIAVMYEAENTYHEITVVEK